MDRKKGFTLVEIMIVVAIIALLATLAIPNLLRLKISANDALAKNTLRTLSTASENYAITNSGNYPSSETDLTDDDPPYLNGHYCDRTISGFHYSCEFSQGGYTFTATPINRGTSGTEVFSITTGGVLSPTN